MYYNDRLKLTVESYEVSSKKNNPLSKINRKSLRNLYSRKNSLLKIVFPLVDCFEQSVLCYSVKTVLFKLY